MADNSQLDKARLRALARNKLVAEDTRRPDADPVSSIVMRANRQVGIRDLLLLAIASLFALILVFAAPLVRHVQTRGGTIAKPAARPRKS